MRKRLLSWSAVWIGLAVAFALRALLLIDATGLWSDELYSVGKSFQPSFGSLLAMLREDTHPPAYYGLLWFWGHLVGQSPVSLRLLSWLAYLAGGLVMVRQAMALSHAGTRVRAEGHRLTDHHQATGEIRQPGEQAKGHWALAHQMPPDPKQAVVRRGMGVSSRSIDSRLLKLG